MTMAYEIPELSIYDFYDELTALLQCCDAHKADIASALVSAAVALAAADGCDSEMQRVNIERFAARAIGKLLEFSALAGIVH
jgi:hypothetical protein